VVELPFDIPVEVEGEVEVLQGGLAPKARNTPSIP
jgi:hypothetical protein